MKKYSTTTNQLMTLYTAPDWLTETERGQKYLYKMAVDMYERINQINENRLLSNLYAPLTQIEEARQVLIEKDDLRKQELLNQYDEMIESIYKEEKVHLDIKKALEKLKESIDNLDYNKIIINIDNIVSISHHGGPAISYAGESIDENDERIRKIKPKTDLERGDDLSSVIYQKWGDYFPEISEGSGFIPEEAVGHNLRKRDWEEISDFSDEKILDNVVSVLKNSILNKKYEDKDEIRIQRTKEWVKRWIDQRFSQNEIIELIFSDIKKYGWLYDILDYAMTESWRDVALKRFFVLLLQGDEDVKDIFKNIDRKDMLKLRFDFNRIMDLNQIEDFIISFPFFKDTILYLEETMEILSDFLKRNPELKNFVYKYYDKETIDFLENNKTASLKLLKIASKIDGINSDLSDKIEKLIKLSDFRSPKEVIRKTGLPPYMRDMMGISTGIDPNKNVVYETPKEIPSSEYGDLLGFAQPATRYNSSFGIKGAEPAEANKNYAVYPEQSFPSVGIHEITHLRDFDGLPNSRNFNVFFNQFIENYDFLYEIEYALNKKELEAYFNEYIYVLYSKQNKISFEDFVNLTLRKKINPDLSIEKPISIMQYLLFNETKNSIKLNGFKNTIRNKDDIFNKVKNNLINNVLAYYFQGDFIGENKIAQFFMKKILIAWAKRSKTLDQDSKQKIISIINQLSDQQEIIDENAWREQENKEKYRKNFVRELEK